MSEDNVVIDSDKIIEVQRKVDKLLRHIGNVQEACQLLGKKLIDRGEIDFGVKLIAAGQIHDHSKWSGIEFDYLIDSEFNGEAKLAATHHNRSNQHHFEYWIDANLAPRIVVAEFVCDIYARSTEFGTDVREYIKEKAIARYGISPQGKVYKWMKDFLDLLLDKPFTQSPKSIT